MNSERSQFDAGEPQSFWTPEYKREYQRKYRANLRRQGYRKIELCLSPRLLSSMAVHLHEYGFGTHPGAAITDLLEDLAAEWDAETLHE